MFLQNHFLTTPPTKFTHSPLNVGKTFRKTFRVSLFSVPAFLLLPNFLWAWPFLTSKPQKLYSAIKTKVDGMSTNCTVSTILQNIDDI